MNLDSALNNRLTVNVFAELMDGLDRAEYGWRAQSEFGTSVGLLSCFQISYSIPLGVSLREMLVR